MFYRLLVVSLAFVVVSPCAFAKSIPVDQRDHTIDERLNCFSAHASTQGVDWDEVCSKVSIPKNEEPQNIQEPDSLDAMIERLHAAADEMLTESVGDEEPAANVDEVYKKHNAVFDNQRTVDDVIREQGIKNDFVSSQENAVGSEKNDLSDTTDSDEVDMPQEDTKQQAKNASKSSVQDVPGLFDEPDLMSDKAKDSTLVELRTHTFDLGYERYYYEYKEDSVQVKLKGWWDTFSAAYTYRPKQGDLLNFDWLNHYRVEARYGFADLDYTSGSTGSDDDEPNYMYETRALVGRDFYPIDRVVVTPYGGFGFRYLLDDSGGRQTTTGQYGYDRKSHYFYLPIGVDYTYQMNKHWRMVANGEYDIFLSGWQKSYLSDVPVPGYFDVRNDQDSGFGVRGSLKLIKTTPLIDFSIEPFVRFWHIDDSEVSNSGASDGLEPENTTLESGVRAGVQF